MVNLAGRNVPAGKSSPIDKEVLADETESFDFKRCADVADRRMRTEGSTHSQLAGCTTYGRSCRVHNGCTDRGGYANCYNGPAHRDRHCDSGGDSHSDRIADG